MSNVFFDIETVTTLEKEQVNYPPKPTVDDVKTGNTKDAAKIKAIQDEKLPKMITEWEDACKKLDDEADQNLRKGALAIDSCKIICLSVAVEDNPPRALTGTEEEILNTFWSIISKEHHEYGVTLIGHNIRKFDLPIIYLRACKYNISELKTWFRMITNRPKYADCFVDTMELAMYSGDKMLSIKKLCDLFGRETKTIMDGSQVHDYYLKNDIATIAEYCNQDVDDERFIYNILT